MKTLFDRFLEGIKEKKTFSPKTKVFIACSGGSDSVSLFHLLRLSAKILKIKISLIHFNHNLRPTDAAKDEKFVRALAEKYKVPICVGQADVADAAKKNKQSIEESARKLRYEFFVKTAKKVSKSVVVFAHTKDDQAETVLMRIIQGTGTRGLQGIRADYFFEGVRIVRPLLDFFKTELVSFLSENKFSFREDKTNNSAKFLRNRVRLELLPMLKKKFNPQIADALARIPKIARIENDFIACEAEKIWRRVSLKNKHGNISLKKAFLLKTYAAIQFRILEKALKSIDASSGIDFAAWQEISQNISANKFVYFFPRKICMEVSRSRIVFYGGERAEVKNV